MSKLNQVIYRKLIAQAEEAKEQGLTKLAKAIMGVVEDIGVEQEEADPIYSYTQCQDDIHKDLWKLASRLMIYYDVESSDASKIDQTILSWASKITDDLETSLEVNASLSGPLEPMVPGEDK